MGVSWRSLGFAKGVKPEIGPRHERRHYNLRFDPFLNLINWVTGLFWMKVSPASLGLAGRGHGRYLGKHEHAR